MYYNQYNYAHVPYPAKGYESATIKSGGCGPCCISMVVEGLDGASFPPPQAAALAISCGARVPGGTDMKLLGRAAAEKYGLELASSNEITTLTAHLAAGGWAIINVGGDRTGYRGLFSDSGHFVAARGIDTVTGRIIVWDPGNYSGKYSTAARRERVKLSGDDIAALPQDVADDAYARSPRYFMFRGAARPEAQAPADGDTPSPWAKQSWDRAAALKILDGTSPKGALTREQLAVVLDRLGLLGGVPPSE